MSLAGVSRSLSRRICGSREAAAWSSAGPTRALRNDGVVGRFFSRQIWSKSGAAARFPDSVVGYSRSYGACGAAGGLFPRGFFGKSAAPGSMWRSSRPFHFQAARNLADDDARRGSSFMRQHKHILVFTGIVSAIGGTLFLMPAQQPTAKEAKNVSAMSINLEEVRKETINNDVEKVSKEEAMNNDVEKARKESAMKARFEAWMKEHNRWYWTRKEKARRYKFFKANAEFVDSMNAKLIKEGKHSNFGTNELSDYSDEELANYGTPAEDFVEFDKLFGSKSFVSAEDLRELNARLVRKCFSRSVEK